METALYLPVKRFLEKLGFTVKGEIGGCDLVALSGDDPPIVVVGELKLAFNLELVLQGVDRAGACDEVWLAAKMSARGKGRESDARFRNLCRRLGWEVVVPAGADDAQRYPTVDATAIDGCGADAVLLPDEPYVFTAEDGPERFVRTPAELVSGRAITWYGPSLVEAHRGVARATSAPTPPEG